LVVWVLVLNQPELPRSGCDSEPRVAVSGWLNRNAVASAWRNPFRVDGSEFYFPRVEATLGFEA